MRIAKPLITGGKSQKSGSSAKAMALLKNRALTGDDKGCPFPARGVPFGCPCGRPAGGLYLELISVVHWARTQPLAGLNAANSYTATLWAQHLQSKLVTNSSCI